MTTRTNKTGREITAVEDIKTTALSFHNMHEHGALFINLLRARRESFIVKNKWVLPESGGLEYDQYDTPSSRWIGVHRGEDVLAGVRLTPTTAKCGMYSYMIRDAQLGLLESIPSNLLNFEAPVDPVIWEATRIFVTDSVPMRLRTRIQSMLMSELIDVAAEHGAKQLIAFGPAIWSRWIGRLGLSAEPAGPVLEIEGSRTQVALMTIATKAESVVKIGEHHSNPTNNAGIIQRARLRRNRQAAQAAE